MISEITQQINQTHNQVNQNICANSEQKTKQAPTKSNSHQHQIKWIKQIQKLGGGVASLHLCWVRQRWFFFHFELGLSMLRLGTDALVYLIIYLIYVMVLWEITDWQKLPGSGVCSFGFARILRISNKHSTDLTHTSGHFSDPEVRYPCG